MTSYLKKILGRDMRCSQSLKLNEARQVKYTIDMGSFVIVVSSNKSFDAPSLFYSNFGILFTFKHIEKNKNPKGLNFKFSWKSFEVFLVF